MRDAGQRGQRNRLRTRTRLVARALCGRAHASDGAPAPPNGVEREIELRKSRGAAVAPVGARGRTRACARTHAHTQVQICSPVHRNRLSNFVPKGQATTGRSVNRSAGNNWTLRCCSNSFHKRALGWHLRALPTQAPRKPRSAGALVLEGMRQATTGRSIDRSQLDPQVLFEMFTQIGPWRAP